MPSLLKEFFIIAVLCLCGVAFSIVSGLGPKPWHERALAPGAIRVEDAKVLDVIWLDARSQTEYATAHIPGALWFNLEDESTSMLELMEAWLMQPKPIIVYCGSQSCASSQQVANDLRQNITGAEVYFLEGGWETWER